MKPSTHISPYHYQICNNTELINISCGKETCNNIISSGLKLTFFYLGHFIVASLFRLSIGSSISCMRAGSYVTQPQSVNGPQVWIKASREHADLVIPSAVAWAVDTLGHGWSWQSEGMIHCISHPHWIWWFTCASAHLVKWFVLLALQWWWYCDSLPCPKH